MRIYIKKGRDDCYLRLFSSQAIKTKEDWQNLFDIASKEIEVQKETIRQQLEKLKLRKQEILKQKALLDSLDKEITEKEKTLNEKQKVLDRQFVQISKQQGEISVTETNNNYTAERGSGTEGYSCNQKGEDYCSVSHD